jgi:signal transduction histidine kinase
MRRRWSMRTRFVAAASACLLPLLGVVLLVLDQSLNNSRDQILDNEIAVSNVVAKSLSQTLDESQSLLVTLAQKKEIQSLSGEDAQPVFSEAQAYRPSLKGIFLLDADGELVTYFGIDPQPLLTSAEVSGLTANALRAGTSGVSNSIAIPGSENAYVVALVAPVMPNAQDTSATQEVEGKTAGAIGTFLDVERLQRAFAPASEFGGDTRITIVAEGGKVVVDQPAAAGQGQDLTEKLAAPIGEAIAGKRTRHVYRDASGVERLAVITPVDFEGAKWAILVTNPSPTAYEPNRNLLERGLIALAAAVTLTLVLAVVFGELTARPIRQLTEQAIEVASGRTDGPLPPVGRGEVANLSVAIRDMAYRLTRQVRANEAAREEVARQAELLRDLLRRTVRLQEDERRRIASDIHDAVSPLITGALFQARALTLSNGRSDADMNGHGGEGSQDNGLATVSDLLERAMAELHGVVFALRPPDLDDLGVVAAIDRYVQQINRTGLPCRLEVIGESQRLSPEARLGIYRIVQEALHNALRHAHADEAVVKMEFLEDKLRVTVRDNGSGFDPEQAASPTSLGLLSMRERAGAIGAKLEIASRPGAGTAVILERPLIDELVTEPVSDVETATAAEALSASGADRETGG